MTLSQIVCLFSCGIILQDLGLQPEDNFVLKVVQLEELIHVRHSTFVIGNAGTGELILLSLKVTSGHNCCYVHACIYIKLLIVDVRSN